MSQLLPCPACRRHVASDERSCPFCGAALSSPRPCAGDCARLPSRLARAALVAASAALLGAGCGSAVPVYGAPPQVDAGPDSSRDANDEAK